MAPGKDYDPTPVGVVALPDSGLVTLDVTPLVNAWLSRGRGRGGGGLVLMLTEDSHPECHYWVSMTEQTNAFDRPTLRVLYEVGR